MLGVASLAATQVQLDRRGTLNRFVDHLERHPGTAVARHGPSDEAVINDFLDGGGIENGGAVGDHLRVREVGDGGGLCRVVIAGDQQHTALGRCAVETPVLDGVAGTKHARPLAVPNGKHPVVFLLRLAFNLLGTPHSGGGEVLVHAALEDDVMVRQQIPCPLQFQVIGADRGPPVPRDIAGGMPAGRHVALFLQQRQAHQRLVARHVELAGIQGVFVAEGYLFERHHRYLTAVVD